MMKKSVFVFLVLCGTLLVSCSNNNPKTVAKNFLEALHKGEFEEAKKYCDESTVQFLDMMIGLGGQKMIEELKGKADSKEVKFEITKVEEDGDKAVVFYKDPETGKESKLPMRKVDGKWKASISKESAKENKAGDNAEVEEESIEIEQPVQDSIQ